MLDAQLVTTYDDEYSKFKLDRRPSGRGKICGVKCPIGDDMSICGLRGAKWR
jgi:hypothetical protein